MLKKLPICLFLTSFLVGCGDIVNIPALTECPAEKPGNPGLHIVGADSGDLVWPSWGGDLENTHSSPTETQIDVSNVNQLQVKWIYKATGSISTTPTITDDYLYVTDWGPGTSLTPSAPGGKLHAINRQTGVAEWSQWIRRYNNDPLNNVSRSSPAIFQDLIIIGDVQNPAPLTFIPSLIDRTIRYFYKFDDPCGAYVYGINRKNGGMVWGTRVGTQMFDQISQSPIVYNDTVFVGVSSNESTYTRSAEIPCCKFRGSFVALDAHTGAIKWRSWMIDDIEDFDQFAGAAIWGGAPTIDPARNSVYIPTGNNYWVPQTVQNCLIIAGTNPLLQSNCFLSAPDNFFDSIVSLDMDDGTVNWVMNSKKYEPANWIFLPPPNTIKAHDAWTTACDFTTLFPLLAASSSTENCPSPYGPDSDFAQPPMLVRDVDLGGGDIRDLLFAGTKGGEFFAIDPNDGAIVWRKKIGPGGLIGGMQFGAATDGQRIYLQNTNFSHASYVLEAGAEAGKLIQSGFWAALDPATGNILWQTQVPGGHTPALPDVNPLEGNITHVVWGGGLGSGHFAWPMGGLTVANGVVYAGVANLEGTMVAMDASNGSILWQYNTGQSIASAPAIVDGRIYWGSGYRTGNEGSRLYSLGLP